MIQFWFLFAKQGIDFFSFDGKLFQSFSTVNFKSATTLLLQNLEMDRISQNFLKGSLF